MADGIIQIEKINLRRGPEDDLTGSPLTTSPLVYSPGMNQGEIAFADDTGRVFIGHSPQPGQKNYQRITHPYQNVEVLTELSPANVDIFNENFAEITPNGHLVSTLSVTGSTWSPIRVEDSLGNTNNYTFVGQYIAIDISYCIINGGVPSRIGKLTAIADGTAAVANLMDRYIIFSSTATVEETYASSSSNFQFRLNRYGTGGGTYYGLEYQNRVGSTVAINFNSNRFV
jgi:hypothetical protein